MGFTHFIKLSYFLIFLVVRKTLYLCLFFVQVWNISCVTNIPVNSQSQEKDKSHVDEVVALIKSSPAWSDIFETDKETTQPILSNLEKISRYDTSIIREAVRSFIQGKIHGGKDDYGVDDMSRIFLLNRYIFDIPEKNNPLQKVTTYGGWRGRPLDGKTVNLLWPFTLDADKKLQLVINFKGYGGVPYRGLEEFDEFSKNFSRRKITAIEK